MRPVIARARRHQVPDVDLADLLEGPALYAGEVGAGDRNWPRIAWPAARSMPEKRGCEVAAWLEEHAREQLDELAFVRRGPEGEIVDVALGVVGGWRPRDRRGWTLVGPTAEILADRAGLALRLEGRS